MLKESDVFAKLFEECCSESYSKSVYEKFKNDDKYMNECEKHQLLYDEIRAELGENSDLLDEFDSLNNSSSSYRCKHTYHQGFKDCIYLLRWMGVL